MNPSALTEADRAAARVTAAAVAEEARVYRDNTEVREANRSARENNETIREALNKAQTERERDQLRARIRIVLPLPYRISPEAKGALAAEFANKQKLASVAPAEWRRRVERLPRCLRVTVACIIWWDYFSERLSSPSQRWADLDDLIAQTAGDFDAEVLAAALIACGYSPFHAIERTRGRDANENTNQEAA